MEAERIDEEHMAAILADADKVAAASTDTNPSTALSEAGTEMAKLKAELDEIDKKQKAVQAKYDDLRKARIPDLMQKAGLRAAGKGSIIIPSGQRVTLVTKIKAGVKAADREQCHAWLRENGLGDLIVEQVNPQTLAATARELIADGKKLPEFFDVFSETMAVLYAK